MIPSTLEDNYYEDDQGDAITNIPVEYPKPKDHNIIDNDETTKLTRVMRLRN